MLYGLLNLPWWGDILAVLLMTHITLIGVTVFLHRNQSHKALELHPVLSHFFRFWLWLTTGMITKEWVAIHRKHHAKCDTVDDPHSPVIHGIRKILLEGTELYRAEAKNQDTLERYGRGTPDDWVEKNVYTGLPWTGIVLMFIIDVLLFGIPGVTIWAVQMLLMPVLGAGIINGIGHYWGYRNYECPEAAYNIMPWGIFIAGEELHNNHHTYPTSAKLSVKWYEFDMGWLYINTFRRLGLAKVYKVPPKLRSVPGKTKIDDETVMVLVGNHFQIMSRYAKEVMLPVLRQEKRRAGEAGKNLFRRAKQLLVREIAPENTNEQHRLKQILANCQGLSLVYQYRLRLQDIWSRTAMSQKELLEALQEWCRQAEATGIDALKQFSSRLRSYVPQKQLADPA